MGFNSAFKGLNERRHFKSFPETQINLITCVKIPSAFLESIYVLIFYGPQEGRTLQKFTFMLPCIVIDFFLNNQTNPLIIQILFCYKILHVSGIFSAYNQEFSTVNSALVSFMQVFDVRFQAKSVPS